MSSRLVLAPTGHPPVPENEVQLSVALDEDGCAPPEDAMVLEKLKQYQENGFTARISRIVAYAGIHYTGEAKDHWDVGPERALMQSAWQDMCNWNPRAESDSSGDSRLLVDSLDNSRRQGNLTEVMAVGAGLVVASDLHQMPYRFWRPTPGLSPYDFRAPASGGMELQLEVRGRFEGNVGNAKRDVRKKFGKSATLARQLGVIFAPRTDLSADHPDLILMDPDSDGAPAGGAHAEYRALLLHYVHFFAHQKFDDFANRLRVLAGASSADFDSYLTHGDAELRRARVKRVSFRFESNDFIGTAWDGTAWPSHIAPQVPGVEFSSGCFYWGLWTQVIDALRDGQLQDVAEMEVNEGVYVDGRRVYLVLDDATALAWAPSRDELIAMP